MPTFATCWRLCAPNRATCWAWPTRFPPMVWSGVCVASENSWKSTGRSSEDVLMVLTAETRRRKRKAKGKSQKSKGKSENHASQTGCRLKPDGFLLLSFAPCLLTCSYCSASLRLRGGPPTARIESRQTTTARERSWCRCAPGSRKGSVVGYRHPDRQRERS